MTTASMGKAQTRLFKIRFLQKVQKLYLHYGINAFQWNKEVSLIPKPPTATIRASSLPGTSGWFHIGILPKYTVYHPPFGVLMMKQTSWSETTSLLTARRTACELFISFSQQSNRSVTHHALYGNIGVDDGSSVIHLGLCFHLSLSSDMYITCMTTSYLEIHNFMFSWNFTMIYFAMFLVFSCKTLSFHLTLLKWFIFTLEQTKGMQ